MSKKHIGCCAAFCKTCPELLNHLCKGCKLGYDNKQRDINKAKCKIKKCCFQKNGFETCADCREYLNCSIIQGFFNKNGYKYKKYKEAMEFIRKNGYKKFLTIAKSWKRAYGKF